MGQSFLDKHGFYQPIKILLSLIHWFLLQVPGNRWKGGQKKGPEDKGGMAGVGGHLGHRERGSSSGFEAQKAKNMVLGSVPSKLIPFRLLILCRVGQVVQSCALHRFPIYVLFVSPHPWF